MSISNGYLTLVEFKEYLLKRRTYTAVTISFNGTNSTITDVYKRLGRFLTAKLIQISGSITANNGVWEVVSVSNSAIVVSGTLTTTAIGASVTITDVSDPENDTLIEQAVESASRAIDTHCDRKFWSNGTDEVRYYSPPYWDCFFAPDDIISITALATDDNGHGTYDQVWAATDYNLLPANAVLDGIPYDKIRIAGNGRYQFPRVVNGLKITGKFGWAAVPAKVKQACYIQAARWYERSNAVYGVIAVTETQISTVKEDLDPDVQLLLQGLVRYVV